MSARQEKYRFNKKILSFLFYSFSLMALTEVTLRLFYHVKLHTPFLISGKDLYVRVFYPEVIAIDKYEYLPDRYNILILDSSVLDKRVPIQLEAAFNAMSTKKIQIVNFSRWAFCSLDSVHQYQVMKDKKFDLVIFYHGINDVRANYVEPSKWRDDYSHYSWYHQVNFFFSNPSFYGGVSILPSSVRYYADMIEERFFRKTFVPKQWIPDSLLQYGDTLKTKEAFAKHVGSFLKLAKQRNQKILLITYAYFHSTQIDQTQPMTTNLETVRAWGRIDQVEHGIDIHNEVTRALAMKENVPILDMGKIFPNKSEYFQDIVHLTPQGERLFASKVIEFLQKSNWVSLKVTDTQTVLSQVTKTRNKE